MTPLVLRVSAAAEETVLGKLRREAGVAYAEPDYLMSASAAPNDPSFSLQWAPYNTGQSVPTQNSEEKLGPPAAGTPGADDRALSAWGVTTGSRSVVIGEADTGIDYSHPDLAANIWANPGGVGGCAAGTHGYNEVAGNCNPMDDDEYYGGHGSHVAGIMGAVGNNGTGVTGMNWQTTILPVKWLDSTASGTTSQLIAALQWLIAAKQAGVNVRVVNDSATFYGTAYSQALSEEIDTLGANNILFVTAAGNTGNNNDEEAVRRYPCGYDRPTEICVAASDNNDQLPSWANYGPHTVQLAAPGVSVYSTLRNNGYGYLSGGSMASPQVAGAAALILSAQPSLSASALRSDILENVDKVSSLSGKVITGGRLDVCKAMPSCVYTPPPPPTTFGKTSIGASSDSYLADRKRTSRYALPSAGAVTKLNIYLAPTGTSGQQVLKGVLYADAGGAPGALLGVSEPLTFKSTQGAGWYELIFPAPIKLAAGNYWIGAITGTSSGVAGFRYDSVSGSRDYNANAYSAGPSDPFGSASTDSEQTSLYATYTAAPVNTAAPGVSGTAQQGQTLTASSGSWSNSPNAYGYRWLRCNTAGAGCVAIGAAVAQTYTLVAGDVEHTIRVEVTASNAGGSSAPASSPATGVVSAAGGPPVDTAAPTITGTAQQGAMLTGHGGSWTNSPTGFGYRWLRCNASGTGCVAIEGANSQTYTLVAGDVERAIRFEESASNAEGAGTPAVSAATPSVLPEPPLNTTAPTISGTVKQGQTLTVQPGSWTNSPTGFGYRWLRCNTAGAGCVAIEGANSQTYTLVAGDVEHTLRVEESATNAGGTGGPVSSEATGVVVAAPGPPANTAAPTITGTAQQGAMLTGHGGSWTNAPTGFGYRWLRCNTAGAGCVAIEGANSQTYTLVAGDVEHAIRFEESASNGEGAGTPAVSAATPSVLPEPPLNTAAPTISGTAKQSQTLTAGTGSWSNAPTGFGYRWLRCNASGTACVAIEGGNSQTYTLVAGDVEHTIRVEVTASNAGGSSAPASSGATALVQAGAVTGTFGKTTVGASSDRFSANRKRVNRYGLAGEASLRSVSVYLAPSGVSGQQILKGVLYADSSGKPAGLLGVTEQLSFKSTNAAGWYLLAFPAAIKLAAGNYWIGVISGASGNVAGFRYDSVGGSRAYDTNTYASGPSNPFGSVTSDSEQASLYVTYTTAPAPVNAAAPTVTGTAQQGQVLTAHSGSWTNEPTGFARQWLRCESLGSTCTAISGANGQTYTLHAADVEHTVKIEETASNAAGTSSPADSAATGTVTAAPVPSNTVAPSITGTAQQGQTLTAQPGSWTGEPTSFAYQWQRCNTSGGSCTGIEGAGGQTYQLGSADVEATLRVLVTASNSAGVSSPATSSQTAIVAPTSLTFGKTTVGGSLDTFAAERKRVNRYALPSEGAVGKLSVYLAPTGTSGEQALKGLIYTDSSGAPSSLLAVSETLSFKGSGSAGWYDLAFASPVHLAAGNYWIGVITGASAGVAGFRYDSVSGARDFNSNPFSLGPTNPFGSASIDSEQMSLYATY